MGFSTDFPIAATQLQPIILNNLSMKSKHTYIFQKHHKKLYFSVLFGFYSDIAYLCTYYIIKQ